MARDDVRERRPHVDAVLCGPTEHPRDSAAISTPFTAASGYGPSAFNAVATIPGFFSSDTIFNNVTSASLS